MSESRLRIVRIGKSPEDLWWQGVVEESVHFSIEEAEREMGRPLNHNETRARAFQIKEVLKAQKPLFLKSYYARLLCDVVDEVVIAANLEVDGTGAEHLRIEGDDLKRLLAAAEALKAACE